MQCDNRRCLCCYGGCNNQCEQCIQGYKCQCKRYRPCCGKVKPPCCQSCSFNAWRKMVLAPQQPPQVQPYIPPQVQPYVQPYVQQQAPQEIYQLYAQPTINQQAYYRQQSYSNMNTIPYYRRG